MKSANTKKNNNHGAGNRPTITNKMTHPNKVCLGCKFLKFAQNLRGGEYVPYCDSISNRATDYRLTDAHLRRYGECLFKKLIDIA